MRHLKPIPCSPSALSPAISTWSLGATVTNASPRSLLIRVFIFVIYAVVVIQYGY